MEQNKLSRFKRILIIVFLACVFCWINCSGVSNPNNDNENNKYIDIVVDDKNITIRRSIFPA